jgi:CubicO group peptidase (beta-lactamase class C family)
MVHDTRAAARSPSFVGTLTRRQYLGWAGGAGLLAALPGCGGGDSDPYNETREWGRQAVREAMQTHNVKSVSVALIAHGETVWQEAFGVMDDRSGAASTTSTRFNIGSVSKVLAALTVSILVDRGLVALDTPVVRYLPQFTMRSPEHRLITLRHLLSHTSGLPGTYMRDLFSTAYLPDYPARQLAWLADQHLKHTPGEMAVYCNDGFSLVESVVFAVTGQTYAQFVQGAILTPLGMTQSVYPLGPLPEGTFAHGYIDNDRQEQEYVMGHATGGLCSTPGDMMKLARMFLN